MNGVSLKGKNIRQKSILKKIVKKDVIKNDSLKTGNLNYHGNQWILHLHTPNLWLPEKCVFVTQETSWDRVKWIENKQWDHCMVPCSLNVSEVGRGEKVEEKLSSF